MYMNKTYVLGTKVEVITDHKPLTSIYNDPQKPRQLRVDRHRTKLLPFRYHVTYEPGHKISCDYGSRHPPKTTINEENKQEWAVEDENDIFAIRVVKELLPSTVTL